MSNRDMNRIRLYCNFFPRAADRVLTSGFTEDSTYELTNDPKYFSMFGLYPCGANARFKIMRSFDITIFEVLLNMSLEQLCRDYEESPCVGKKKRCFQVPGTVLNRCAEIKAVPLETQPDAPWNEYPQLQIEQDDRTQTSLPIAVIGAPGHLEGIPQLIAEFGFAVHINQQLQDGDAALFCISMADGPMPETVQSLQLCRGRRLVPLAILCTNFAIVEDESLHSLVCAELHDLLSKFLPENIIERMPRLIHGDPFLQAKLFQILSTKPSNIDIP